jgi:hypothetical protein
LRPGGVAAAVEEKKEEEEEEARVKVFARTAKALCLEAVQAVVQVEAGLLT